MNLVDRRVTARELSLFDGLRHDRMHAVSEGFGVASGRALDRWRGNRIVDDEPYLGGLCPEPVLRHHFLRADDRDRYYGQGRLDRQQEAPALETSDVAIEAVGYSSDDNYFHLLPGIEKTVRLTPHARGSVPSRFTGSATALNAMTPAKVRLT